MKLENLSQEDSFCWNEKITVINKNKSSKSYRFYVKF